MASFNKYNVFVENLAEKVHDLSLDSLRIALASGTGATGSWVTGLRDVGEINEGNGYILSGKAVTVVSSLQTGGFYKLTLNSPTTPWTGGPSPMTGFRYAVLYNDTPTGNPMPGAPKPLIGYWDYGTSVVLNSGETFTVTLDGVNGTLTIQ